MTKDSVFTSEKKLGFGLMRLPLLDENNAESIDIELTKQMVDAFLEKGFTYFDTAWMYCGFQSDNATSFWNCKRKMGLVIISACKF